MIERSHVEQNLKLALNDPTKADNAVKAINSAIDEVVKAAETSMQVAKDANETAEEYHKQVVLLTKSNIDLSGAIKNIHLKLNEHADLVDQRDDLAALRKELAKYVLGTSAIKMGVQPSEEN